MPETSPKKNRSIDFAKTSDPWNAAFDSITDLVSIHDMDFRIVKANRAFSDAVGLPLDQIVGKKCFEVIHGRGTPWPCCPHVKALSSRQSETEEFFEPRLGQRLNVTCFPIMNDRREIVGSVHIARNISARAETLALTQEELRAQTEERRRAEEELNKLMKKDQEALRVARMGHWEFDVATAQFAFNDQYYSLHGTTAEEAGGYLMSAEKFASRYVHPDDAHLVREHIRQAIETDDPDFQLQAEARLMRADGEPRDLIVWFRVEKDPQGRTTKLHGVNQDITERKKAEEELKRLRLHLWHADRVAQTAAVAASLAHELNQPLGAILTNAEVGQRIMTGANPNLEEIREIFADIVQDDMRAGAVVSGLRDLLRRKETRREKTNLADMIRRTIKLLHSELQGKQVQLHLALEPNSLVLADKAQVQQVILNLVMNAVEAMQPQPAGLRQLELTTTHTDAGEALVAIRDSGPGIPEDQHGKVFEAFWTTKHDGLGVGLMISRSIIESHRGRIWFANNPHKGVTFYFTLPLMVDPDLTGPEAGR